MNIALAVGLLTAVYTFHHPVRASDDSAARIGWVKDGGAASKAGLRTGDLISRLDDISDPKWKEVNEREEISPNQPLQTTVQRGSQTLSLTVVPEPSGRDKIGDAGWEPDEAVEVTAIKETLPAFQAGVRKGDVITGVDGIPMRSVLAFIQHLQDTQGKPLELTVLRNGQPMQFKMQPILEHSEVDNSPVYRVGFSSARTKISQLPLRDAWRTSLADNRKSSLMLLQLLQRLVRGKVSIKQFSGPIGIGKAAGDAVEEGLEGHTWFALLGLVCMISLQLGLFNLLPIPILDGGVILLLLIESMLRRDISVAVKERIYQTAFVFLVLFASVVIFNDFSKLPWFSKS